MAAGRLTHVSVYADDLEETAGFYEDLFGAERIPSTNFGPSPLLWLRLGEQQLHLFTQVSSPGPYHHFALHVDDFEQVYRKAKERGALDGETFGAAVRYHTSGWVQMYLRDPTGNLVEVNWPDVATLDRAAIPDLVAHDVPQEGDQQTASVYLEPPA